MPDYQAIADRRKAEFRCTSVVVVLVLGLLVGGIASASSLRFFGNGVNDIDRVKIQIDNPADNSPGPPADVGATDFTIEFWLIATADNDADPFACISNNNWILGNMVVDRDRYSQGREWGISLGGGRVAFGVSNSSQNERTLCGTTDVRDGNWHHVAVQRRRSDGRLWIWVDGALEAEQDGPDGDISYPDDGVPNDLCGPSGNASCAFSDPFIVIGAEKHDAGSGYPSFSGWVDEVRISTVLRYSAPFSPPTQPFNADADTAALYHFDEGAGDFIGDSAFNSLSPGTRSFGGNPPGPQWTSETPFMPGNNAGTLRLSSSVYAVGEGQATLTIDVERINGSTGAVSVDYSTSDGSATTGSDYQAASGTLNWADGDTASRSFSVTVLDDSSVEGDETFTVSLSGAAGGASLGSPADATVTIQDDDVLFPGSLQFSSPAYSAGEASSTTTYTVTRSGGTDGAVSVEYFLDGGSATEGSDFQPVGGTLNWADGDGAQKTISLTIVDDSLVEGDETVVLSLRNAAGGATIGAPGTATLTIIDNDIPSPGTLQFSTAAYSVGEATSTASFIVTRTTGTDGAVSVDYFLDGGTATEGSDFQPIGGTLNWADGDGVQQTISVAITDDSLAEGDETIVLSLRNAAGGATIGTPGTATLTIVDNDVPNPGSLQFSSATYSIDESGSTATISVTRTGGTDGAVSIDYFVNGGTATAGSDFQSVSGTLNWADGDAAQKSISMTILDDNVDEADETVVLGLRNVSGGATIGMPDTATLTITDDDSPLPPPPRQSGGGGGSSELPVLIGLFVALMRRRIGRQANIKVHA